MKFIQIVPLVLALLINDSEASEFEVPLPGLYTKPHLKGLKRSDINLDLLIPRVKPSGNHHGH